MTNLIIYSIGVFLAIILILVVILLTAKAYLMPSGNVTVKVNDKEFSVPQGATLLATLAEQGVHLPSACGGKGSCGQCKCQVPEGGGEILDSEKGQFTRKQIKEHYRLGSTCVILSRSFCDVMKIHHIGIINDTFLKGVRKIRELEQECAPHSEYFRQNQRLVEQKVAEICADMAAGRL